MDYLQIEMNVEYHRDRLLREAAQDRLAEQVRSASTTITTGSKRQARRGALTLFWRRLAAQTA